VKERLQPRKRNGNGFVLHLAARNQCAAVEHLRYKIAGNGKLSWCLGAQKEESKSGDNEAEGCTNDLQGGYETLISICAIARWHGTGWTALVAVRPLSPFKPRKTSLRLHTLHRGLRSWDKWSRNETGDNLPHLAVLWRESLFFLSAEREPIVFEYSIFSKTQDAKACRAMRL